MDDVSNFEKALIDASHKVFIRSQPLLAERSVLCEFVMTPLITQKVIDGFSPNFAEILVFVRNHQNIQKN